MSMKDQALEIAEKHLGHRGKMISFSKSGYAKRFPDNLVIFNSNVCTEEGKIWYGDMDITLSYNDLADLAKDLNETIYVLREMDGRFENEEVPRTDRAIVSFFPEGGHRIDEMWARPVDSTLKTKK